MPIINMIELPIAVSMEFDKEQFLDDLVGSMRTTRDEFERLYILEEFPMQVTVEDYCDFPYDSTRFRISTKQEFTIRRKTAEEMTEDISHHITQGEN